MSKEFRGEIWVRDENLKASTDVEFKASQQDEIAKEARLNRHVRELGYSQCLEIRYEKQ